MKFIISLRVMMVFIFVSLAFALVSCKNEKTKDTTTTNHSSVSEPADTIFIGGPILTINPVGTVEALAVRNGLIVAVGSEASAMALKGPATKVINLNGKTLMPGFVEPHLHIGGTAFIKFFLPVGSEAPGNTLDNIRSKLAQGLSAVPPGGWLIAAGYDASRTDPLFATMNADELDKVSTTVPIFLADANYHVAYVNHKALQVAGINDNTPNPPHGEFARDAQGHLTGQLNEASSWKPFLAKMGADEPSHAALDQAYKSTFRDILRAGVTTAADMNTGLNFGVDTEVALLRKYSAESPLRLVSYLSYVGLKPGQPLPAKPFEGDDKLRFIGIKFTGDGSTQGFMAALNEPYLNGKNGELAFPNTQELLAAVRPFFDAGWQIAMHANGDRAADQVLEVYGKLLAKEKDPAARRLRLEHFTVNEERQAIRAAQLGVTISITSSHIFYWGQVFYKSLLGPARASRIGPAASLKKLGVRFSYNGDSPFSPTAPLSYMQNAVTRVPQLTPPNVLGAAQRISIDDALRAVTLDAAYQLFMDDKVGSLEVGKYADVIVLEKNPRTVDPNQLANIKIIDVYLAGVRLGSTQLSE